MNTTRKILIFLLVTTLLLGLMTLTASAASVEYEDGYEDPYDDFEYDYLFSEDGARIYLALVGALLGIALPAVPLTIFLVKLIKRRSECEFIDYATIALSALWLIVGVTLFIFVL